MTDKIIKEKSYMIALPKNSEELNDIELIMNRIKDSEYFTIQNVGFSEDDFPAIEIEYNGDTYSFTIYPEPLQIPEMFRIQHLFKDIDIEEIEKRDAGLLIEMEFSDKILDSYHLQLKIITTIFPETLAVLDASSEKILSGTWVNLAAKCNTPPAPRYIFTAQAVYSSDEDVWLHTHGLNRCGLMELEVLGSTKETYSNHYAIIEAAAARLIEEPDSFEDPNAMYVARLCNNQPVIVTWVPWQEIVKNLDEGKLGGANDRTEESGHNGYTGSLAVFVTPEDMDNGNYSHLSVFDELLANNPMIMISNEETARMKSLALDRLDYMKNAFNNKAKAILVKVGLEIDDEYKTDTNEREHIWFELKDISENTFTAELTQEPYMVSSMHTGDVGTYSYDDITDWLIFTEEHRISSDEVYLLGI